MSKKKEYNNIFAKLIEFHNNEVIPLIKLFNIGSLKIKSRRILLKRDKLQDSEEMEIDFSAFAQYLICNIFLLNLLNKEEKDNCFSLITSSLNKDYHWVEDESNFLIGVSCLYNLIESKKEELLNNLNK